MNYIVKSEYEEQMTQVDGWKYDINICKKLKNLTAWISDKILSPLLSTYFC